MPRPELSFCVTGVHRFQSSRGSLTIACQCRSDSRSNTLLFPAGGWKVMNGVYILVANALSSRAKGLRDNLARGDSSNLGGNRRQPRGEPLPLRRPARRRRITTSLSKQLLIVCLYPRLPPPRAERAEQPCIGPHLWTWSPTAQHGAQ